MLAESGGIKEDVVCIRNINYLRIGGINIWEQERRNSIRHMLI